MAVTKAAIDCHSEHDNSPTSSVVGLFFTLAETGHLTNTEYISILTTGCDLIGKKFYIGMILSGVLWWLESYEPGYIQVNQNGGARDERGSFRVI